MQWGEREIFQCAKVTGILPVTHGEELAPLLEYPDSLNQDPGIIPHLDNRYKRGEILVSFVDFMADF